MFRHVRIQNVEAICVASIVVYNERMDEHVEDGDYALDVCDDDICVRDKIILPLNILFQTISSPQIQLNP